jgi:tRNA(Ile)-lysidine synthase
MPRRAPPLAAQLSSHITFRSGERIGVAVSGGADSVAFLRLLLELQPKFGFVPCVVHFNHKLRGKASDADEKFVAALAKKFRLEFFSASADVAAKARREKINLEDAARRSRYAFFDQLVTSEKIQRVAVAHTADDQAETVLAHIFRGTGLAGLGGIHPEAGNVVRPLLSIRRADLRTYLHSKRQPWREDASNRDTARNRARIRIKVMPLLERLFQPTVVDHLCRLADLAREDESFLRDQVLLLSNFFVHSDARSNRLPLAEFLSQPRAMQTRLVRHIVESVKPHPGQLGASHVDSVLSLATDHGSGKSLNLPGKVEVLRDRDYLHFRSSLAPAHSTHKSSLSAEPANYSYPVDISAKSDHVHLVELSYHLRFTPIDWPREGRETTNTGAVFDRKSLRAPLVVRNWKPGDAMRPLGHQKRHTLARLLNELGVSRWEKASWPVLVQQGVAQQDLIVWARGLPVAAEFAPGPDTRVAVVIQEDQDS